MTKVRRTIPLLAFASVLALAACGDDDGAAPSTGDRPTAADLDGKIYVVKSASGIGLPADTKLQLDFADGNVGMSGGCNLFSAAYDIVDGVLVLDGPLGGTEMACEEPKMNLDTDASELLAASPQVSIEGDTLVLATAQTSVTLQAS
jgi:heat shock protein HslJ